MYIVYVTYRVDGSDSPASLKTQTHQVKSLDQVEFEAVGVSVHVTIFDEEGDTTDAYCGPEVQFRITRNY